MLDAHAISMPASPAGVVSELKHFVCFRWQTLDAFEFVRPVPPSKVASEVETLLGHLMRFLEEMA